MAAKRPWAAAGAALVLSTGGLQAAELILEPRIGAGVGFYEFELDGAIDLGGAVVDGLEFDDTIALAGAGLGASYGRLFVDLYGQLGIGGDDRLDLDTTIAGSTAPFTVTQDTDFDRIETLATLGYQLTDQVALFGGFRYAKASWDGRGTVGGGPAGFSADFEQYGPFVGTGLALPVPAWGGALVGNAALAYLRGEVDVDFAAPTLTGSDRFTGDTWGYNLGAGWVAQLSPGFKAVLGVDVSRYDFEDDNRASDFTEMVTRLRAELRYSFGAGAAQPAPAS